MKSLDLFLRQCKACYKFFNGDEHDKLCPDCFENAVEEHEIRKRRIIAERSEY